MVAGYATLLRDHVTLTCRSVDRIFLQAYVPKLQSVGWVCRFLRWQRGFFIPSSAAFRKIGRAYEAEVNRFAEANGIPVRRFAKGEDKEEIARPLTEAAAASGGGRVALIGIAQEKAVIWHSWKAKGQRNAGHPHMEGTADGVHQPLLFLPVGSRVGLSALEKPTRMLRSRSGSGSTAMNGPSASWPRPGSASPRWTTDSARARTRSCCSGSATGSARARSPASSGGGRPGCPRRSPVRTLRAGYVYELAFRQFEVSGTRVFDRPAAGRAFFEGLIRDHLDLGRPDQVSLVFGRRVTTRTPGAFRTRVITRRVDPEIVCYYRSSRLKQYFKQHRALRTELVVCDTRDFGVGRRLTYENWNALRDVGEHANQRLCDAEAASAQPAPDVATLNQVTRPSLTSEGQHAPALRFGDARVMALMAATAGFCHLIAA